jgi:hypothetical protein
MRKVFYLIILFSSSRQVFGQTNLVPNPSFEDTVGACVNAQSGPSITQDEVKKAKFWKNFSMSTDYFNACSPSSPFGVSVPVNIFGYQPAASGVAYCGMVVCHDTTSLSNVRETFGAPLTQTLSIGQKYFVSIKVVRADLTTGYCAACNKIGVKFATFDANYGAIQNNPLANNIAHIYTNSLITDSISWTRIKGSFIADSNYKFIIIGNFFKDNQTIYQPCTTSNQMGYYYVDDVCVSTDSLLCSNFTTDINEKQLVYFLLFPNPTSGNISIKLFNQAKVARLNIFDNLGKTIFAKTNLDSDEIDLHNISDGLYFIEIVSDGRIYYDKIVVRH